MLSRAREGAWRRGQKREQDRGWLGAPWALPRWRHRVTEAQAKWSVGMRLCVALPSHLRPPTSSLRSLSTASLGSTESPHKQKGTDCYDSFWITLKVTWARKGPKKMRERDISHFRSNRLLTRRKIIFILTKRILKTSQNAVMHTDIYWGQGVPRDGTGYIYSQNKGLKWATHLEDKWPC